MSILSESKESLDMNPSGRSSDPDCPVRWSNSNFAMMLKTNILAQINSQWHTSVLNTVQTKREQDSTVGNQRVKRSKLVGAHGQCFEYFLLAMFNARMMQRQSQPLVSYNHQCRVCSPQCVRTPQRLSFSGCTPAKANSVSAVCERKNKPTERYRYLALSVHRAKIRSELRWLILRTV